MRVNGKERRIQKEMTLLCFLNEEGYAIHRVAIELNGKIVPQNKFENTVLKDSDTLEVVSFVGGG